jgi:ribulose-phosphate 3-epimerase
MSIICPTVLALNKQDLESQLSNVEFANRIQIDVMDGIFTANKSIALSEIETITEKTVDLHVMYKNPQDYLADFVRIKPSMVIVHAESNADIPKLASELREHGIKTGLALLQDTSVESVSYLFPHVQHLLIFSGDLGKFGGQADLSLLVKIEQAKKITRFLEYGWDGGANEQNVSDMAQAGVDVINVGGAIQNAENAKATYEQLVAKV